MPLVFTQNEVNLSGIEYADVLGEVYEFPARYLGLIEPGEQFLYYRGRRRAGGKSSTPEYFGTGLVGQVWPVGQRYRCSITNYQPFDPPVPFKDGGGYREPEANQHKAVGYYFEPGVRRLDQDAFDAICEAGLGGSAVKLASATYAEPELARKVDEMAMRLAMAEAEVRWPNSFVRRMPHNSPGFDIEIGQQGGARYYIEVKGTRADQPRFFISAGEVAYSRLHHETYSLWIFHSMDLDTGDAVLVEHDGAIDGATFELQPMQYLGRFRDS